MSTADAWTHVAPGSAYKPGGWSARPRYAPIDFVTLLWREKGLMVGIFLLIFAIGMAAALSLKTSYTAYSSILVKLGQEYVYQPRAGDAGRGAVPDSDAVIASEVEILNSGQLKERVILRLGINTLYPKIVVGPTAADQTAALAKAVRAFEQGFQLETAADVPAIKLAFKHDDPQMAARALNTLMDEYLLYRRTVLMESSAPALEAQRKALQQQLATTDAAYQNFLNFNNLGDFESEKQSLAQVQAQLEQQKYTLESSLRERQGRLGSLNAQLPAVPAESAVYRDMNLKSSEARDDLMRKRAELLSRYTPDSQPVREINQQIGELDRALSAMPAAGDAARRIGPNPVFQTLQTEKIQLTSEVAALRQSLAAVTEQLSQVTERQLRLAALEPQISSFARDRDVLQTNVRDFTVREQESRSAEAIAESGADNIRIVGRATAPVQGSSPRKIVAILAFLFAGFTALCAGLVHMFLRTDLATASSAGRTLDLPVLGAARVKR